MARPTTRSRSPRAPSASRAPRAPRVSRAVALALVTFTLLASACGGDEPEGAGSSGTSPPVTACDKDTRKDVYSAGLTKQGAAIAVTIVDATPSPPIKGTNAMTLQVRDPAGVPLDGATVSVTPYMPDHAHGSAVVPVVAGLGEGKYAVSKLYFPMAGLWKITVTVQVQGAPSQEVAFNFCFDG